MSGTISAWGLNPAKGGDLKHKQRKKQMGSNGLREPESRVVMISDAGRKNREMLSVNWHWLQYLSVLFCL